MAERVLIVDDDPVQRRLVENVVTKAGYEAVAVDGGEAAIKLLSEGAPFDCVVLDLVMPDLDGLGVLAKMREASLTIPVIVETAHGGIDNVVTAMRAGAVDFVIKPVGAERLTVSLRNAMTRRALEGEIARFKRSRSGTLSFRDILTRSPPMQAVLRAAEKTVNSSIPVLIEGESGVGKELIARAIHGSGERRAKAFVAVNCGALPENLVESILFGHEKGAFTGAAERHLGKFIEAAEGTLLLDEVGELPLSVQVKLLRAIQENEVEPVGGKRPVKVNVRIISATNRNLMRDVQTGRFREDLFYRLHVFPITVPPLRARPEDIPALARHFLLRFAAEEGKRIESLTADALALLTAYHWPGNVRQLENAMFRAVVLADSENIGVGEFPQIAAHCARPGPGEAIAPEPPESAKLHPEADQPLLIDLGPDRHPRIPAGPFIPGESEPLLNLLDAAGEVRPLEDIEAQVIKFALSHYGGHMSEAARRLRIGRSTLYRKLGVRSMVDSEGA